jgi:DNA polymerase-3 subunit delta
MGAMDALAFLERSRRGKPLPLYVVSGDEDFLKRQVLATIRSFVLPEDDDAYGLSRHPGDKADFATVHDELAAVPLYGGQRLVIVENADPFVTRHRALLEKAIGHLPSSGVLVLEVKSWPSNTRLAKVVDEAATIICKAPAAYRLPAWCEKWCSARYGKQVPSAAASLLVDLVGADMGLLDQELCKLSIFAGARPTIDVAAVDQLVGRSRAESIWKIFDAIGEGNSAAALTILDRLLDQGEEPMRILGAFSMQLRRLAQAARLHALGQPLPAALAQVGVLPFAIKNGEAQLKHLGLRRLQRLYDRLLEIDTGLKGGSPLSARVQLERFVVGLARKN